MRYVTIAVVALSLCFLSMFAHADEAWVRPQATALRVPDGAITLDGLEREWQRLGDAGEQHKIISNTKQLVTVWQPLFGDYTGPDDLSMTVKVAHDSNFLYVLAQVHDNLLINQATAEQIFNGDDFELFIDASPVESRFGTTKGADYRQFIFLPAHLNPAFPQPFIWHAGEMTGVRAVSALRPWGYTIAVAIPKALFPNWRAHPDMDAIGFDAMISDCDTAGIDCSHPAVKSSCYALSNAQHQINPSHLATLLLPSTPVTLSAPLPPAKELSVRQVRKLAQRATAENADTAAQAVLDLLDDKNAEQAADAAVRSPQSAVRKTGLYLLYQRKELKAPIAQVQALLVPGTETPVTLTRQEERVYAMLALAVRGQLPVAATGAFYTQPAMPRSVKLSYLWALGANGDHAATPLLITVLKNEASFRARMAAALALGLLADKSALPALQETMAKDDNGSCRQQAKLAIAQLQK